MNKDSVRLIKGEDNLDKNTSDIIKGILIILIVLGHNSILTSSIDGLYSYLYSFHVIIFFILPWFYVQSRPTITKSVNRCKKLYLYYLFFFILQIILYNLLIDNNFSLCNSVHAFILGGHHALKDVTGYMYLWFLPAFCFSMLLYDLYNGIAQHLRIIPNVLAFVVVCLFTQLTYQNYNAFVQAVYFASVGITSVGIYNIMHLYMNRTVSVVAFILLSILVCTDVTSVYVLPFMPFVAFFAIWDIAKFLSISKNNIIVSVGKMSLMIYLIHPLVYQALLRVIPNMTNQIVYGVIILILTLGLTIFSSYVIEKIIVQTLIKKLSSSRQ